MYTFTAVCSAVQTTQFLFERNTHQQSCVCVHRSVKNFLPQNSHTIHCAKMTYEKILILVIFVASVLCADDEFISKGCYADQPVSAISGGYVVIEQDAIESCFRIAEGKGSEVFAIENHNRCYTSRDAYRTYWKYGPSEHCYAGRGGVLAMDVYMLRPTSSFILNKMHLMDSEIKHQQDEIDRLTNGLARKEEEINFLKKLIKTYSETMDSRVAGINIRLKTGEMISESTRKNLSDIQCFVEQNTQNIAALNRTIGHTRPPFTSEPSTSKTTRVTTSHPSLPPPTTTQSYWIYYPQATTEHQAERHLFGFSFLGYGHGNGDRRLIGMNLTVKECAWRCSKEHEHDPAFNGFSYVKGLGIFYTCFCQRNDNNNVSSAKSLHYRRL